MIKRIGDTDIREYHLLGCHCGAVQIEMHLPDGVVDPKRCDCSLCRRRGAIMGTSTLACIRIIKGEDKLGLYQFNTQVAKHYFCTVCGIYTHHQRRSNPAEYGYNIACLKDVNPFELGDIMVMDGINHPSDRQRGPA